MSKATILLVDDDETLSRVLQRVLTQQGYTVVEAGDVAQALQLARQHEPQLGLLDLKLSDGDGVELARRLKEAGGDFPVILMTAYPLRLRDQPALAQQFVRVLTKPLNLQELRQAIEGALSGKTAALPAIAASPAIAPARPSPPEPVASLEAPPVPSATARPYGMLFAAVAVCLLVGLGAAATLGYVPMPSWPKKEEHAATSPAERSVPAALIVASFLQPDGIELPADVVEALGVTTAVVEEAKAKRPLVLSGTINYDADYLARIRPRFGGEIVEMGQIDEPGPAATQRRNLSFVDRVRQGDLLAVVWSKDLGQQKSALIDALVKLKFDEETLKNYEELLRSGGTSEALVRAQRTQVASDRNMVATAERTLKVWRVDDVEIKAVQDEAQLVFERKGIHDAAKEKDWARVEVRAPFDGTIVEKNVALRDNVDTSTDLFRVADLHKLAVWANAYEDDLRLLQGLPRPIPWTVRALSNGKDPNVLSIGADKIAPAIDPNQHTALVIGRADNRKELWHVGQFVAATILLDAPGGTVSVPVSAVDEDGEASVVFVQPDSTKPRFHMRQVAIAQRLNEATLVRSQLTDAEVKRGLQPLLSGERIVTRQTYALRAALQDLQDKAKQEAKQKND